MSLVEAQGMSVESSQTLLVTKKKRGRKPKFVDTEGNPVRIKKRRTKDTAATTESSVSAVVGPPQKVESVGIFWSPVVLTARARGILQNIHAYYAESKVRELLIPYSGDDDEGAADSATDDFDSWVPVHPQPQPHPGPIILRKKTEEEIDATTKTHLRLRVLDWLVTNWSKKHNIVLVAGSGARMPININEEYRNMLVFYTRKHFDAFRRHDRIYYEYNGKTLATTVAQLNFMKWIDETHILQYARRNWKEIAEDMRTTSEQNKAKKKQSGKKRHELSKASNRTCHVVAAPFTMTLDLLKRPSST